MRCAGAPTFNNPDNENGPGKSEESICRKKLRGCTLHGDFLASITQIPLEHFCRPS
jgi:hypothetical protein